MPTRTANCRGLLADGAGATTAPTQPLTAGALQRLPSAGVGCWTLGPWQSGGGGVGGVGGCIGGCGITAGGEVRPEGLSCSLVLEALEALMVVLWCW